MSGMVVVTGGSRGIGAAVARRLGRAGYAVAVNYATDAAAARLVCADIVGAGGRSVAIQGDIALEADILRLFAEAEQALGPLAALVNNAGILGGLTRVEVLTADALRRVFEVNVIGTILCARQAVRFLSTVHGGPGGSIVNLSSRAAELGGPGELVHYAATKGAIDSFTIGLAREVAGEGIRVNAVAPGLIDTEMNAARLVPLAQMAATVPMRRTGTAEEIAETVLWLLSPAASYVTGAIVPVSGGR